MLRGARWGRLVFPSGLFWSSEGRGGEVGDWMTDRIVGRLRGSGHISRPMDDGWLLWLWLWLWRSTVQYQVGGG